MIKRSVFLIVVALMINLYAERPPVPAIGSEMSKHVGNCKVPEMLVNIPPMMEDDYKSCVNDRNKPSKALVDVVLKQQVDKAAKFVKIETAPRFYTRVYKITYKLGSKEESMICNDKMTYCLKDKPIVSRER